MPNLVGAATAASALALAVLGSTLAVGAGARTGEGDHRVASPDPVATP